MSAEALTIELDEDGFPLSAGPEGGPDSAVPETGSPEDQLSQTENSIFFVSSIEEVVSVADVEGWNKIAESSGGDILQKESNGREWLYRDENGGRASVTETQTVGDRHQDILNDLYEHGFSISEYQKPDSDILVREIYFADERGNIYFQVFEKSMGQSEVLDDGDDGTREVESVNGFSIFGQQPEQGAEQAGAESGAAAAEAETASAAVISAETPEALPATDMFGLELPAEMDIWEDDGGSVIENSGRGMSVSPLPSPPPQGEGKDSREREKQITMTSPTPPHEEGAAPQPGEVAAGTQERVIENPIAEIQSGHAETQKEFMAEGKFVAQNEHNRVEKFDFDHGVVRESAQEVNTGTAELIAERWDDLELIAQKIDLRLGVEAARQVAQQKELRQTFVQKFERHLDFTVDLSLEGRGNGFVAIEEKNRAPLDLKAETAVQDALELHLQQLAEEAEFNKTQRLRLREKEEEEEEARQRARVAARFEWPPEEEEEADDASGRTGEKAMTAFAAARRNLGENLGEDDELTVFGDEDEQPVLEIRGEIVDPQEILDLQTETHGEPLEKSAEPSDDFENVIAAVLPASGEIRETTEEGQSPAVQSPNAVQFRQAEAVNNGIELYYESEESNAVANNIEQGAASVSGQSPASAAAAEESAQAGTELPFDIAVNQAAA